MNEKFQLLGLPIPEQIVDYPKELQQSIYDYLGQLGDYERKAYVIAKEHLGTSFNIVRSTGYIEWKNNKK